MGTTLQHSTTLSPYKKLKIIAQALNEGWTPDWSNSNEYKYYAWFRMSVSGLSYNDYDYTNTNTNTNVSSHLCNLFTQYRPCSHSKK